MSTDGCSGGDRREMEVDHRVLAGRVSETLRGSQAGNARRLAEGPHPATPRADERWDRAATTDGRDSGASRVFADRLWPIGGAFGGSHSPLGQSAYGAIDFFGFRRRFNRRNQTRQKNVRQKNEERR